MKKLLNLSPFIMLLIPVFLGAALIVWNSKPQSFTEVSDSFTTATLIGVIKTTF